VGLDGPKRACRSELLIEGGERDLIDGGGEPPDDGGHQLGGGQVGDVLLDYGGPVGDVLLDYGGPVGEVFLGGELVGCAQSMCGRGAGQVPGSDELLEEHKKVELMRALTPLAVGTLENCQM